MPKKNRLLIKCAEVLKKPHVMEWYQNFMEKKSQYYTIESLEKAVSEKKFSVNEALCVALVIEVQWDIKFPGVD